MKRLFCIIIALLISIGQIVAVNASESEENFMITNPKVEKYYEQLGVSCTPSFSWECKSSSRGVYQEAYRIIIYNNSEIVSDSGKIYSSSSQGVAVNSEQIKPCTRYTWDLFVWDNMGNMAEVKNLEFVTEINNWSGDWISTGKARSFYARETFNVNKEVESAYTYVCGLGQFKLYLNGTKIGNHELDPGWTDYDESVQYVTFDVKGYILKGENAIGVSVGNGWYVGQRVNHFYSNSYTPFSDHLPLICEMVITYTDGEKVTIASNTNWRVHDSATEVANVYGSEHFNGTLYPEGWTTASFDDSDWKSAVIADAPKGKMVAQSQPPVIVKKVYDTVSVTNVNESTNIFDLGQNMSGMFEIYVSGPRGSVVTITPVEKLNSNGKIEKTVDTVLKYTLKGTGEVETWKPDFSYAGGRWVQIEGARYSDEMVDGEVIIHDVKGHFVTNSAYDSGNFCASDERYNKIYNLILKAIESNLQSVHTDCPTIEKLGWLETSHLMAPSVLYNKNGRELFSKIARDAAEAQEESGLIPDVAPAYPHFSDGFWDSPAWGSAGIITPWLLYEYYGDTYSLEENYEAMVKYAQYLKSKEDKNGMLTHGLGDWGIAPQTGESHANIETAIYYWDLCILRDTSLILGLEDNYNYFAHEAERVKTNYNNLLLYYSDATGGFAYHNITQANQAIALYLGLVPEDKEEDVLKAFKKTLSSGKIDSGEIGLPFIFRAACKYKLTDYIQTMIMQPEHKSYYRFILMGETTLPEFWVDNARSRNHDMLGSVMEWFYSAVGGITPISYGFGEISIAPQIPKGLESAHVTYESVKGEIVSSWKHTGNTIYLKAVLPANTQGVVSIPTCNMKNITVTESGKSLYEEDLYTNTQHITFVSKDEDCITFAVTNGIFNFTLTGESDTVQNEEIEYNPESYSTPKTTPLKFTPIASSDVNAWGWTLSASHDGNRNSVSGALGWSSNAERRINHNEWYMLDFGNVQSVNRVDIYPRNDSPNQGLAFPVDFVIEASSDGVNWKTVKDVKNHPTPTNAGAQVFTFDREKCRYLRIYATNLSMAPDGYRMQFSEVEAYMEPVIEVTNVKKDSGSVSGNISCFQSGKYILFGASYSGEGELIHVSVKSYTLNENEIAQFSLETAKTTEKIALYVWDANNFEPMCASITI